MPKPATINQYIAAAPTQTRARLRAIQAAIAKAAPGATQGIKWGMPAFWYKRILITFAVFKHHIGMYPTPSAVKAFPKELSKYATARGSIQFPLDKPLPLALIRKIAKFRVKESIKRDGHWRTPLRKS